MYSKAPKCPTPCELAAIEREWPRIEADLAVLDAEIRVLTAAGGPSPLDWRRLRRARRRVLVARALPALTLVIASADSEVGVMTHQEEPGHVGAAVSGR